MATQTPVIPPSVAGPNATFIATDGFPLTQYLRGNLKTEKDTYKWQWIPDGPNDVAVAKYGTHRYQIVNGPIEVTGSGMGRGLATASFSTLKSGVVNVNADGPNGLQGLGKAPTDPLVDNYIFYPGPTGITSVEVGVQSVVNGQAYVRTGSITLNFGKMQIEDKGVTITP